MWAYQGALCTTIIGADESKEENERTIEELCHIVYVP